MLVHVTLIPESQKSCKKPQKNITPASKIHPGWAAMVKIQKLLLKHVAYHRGYAKNLPRC